MALYAGNMSDGGALYAGAENFDNSAPDTTPDAFSFTPVTGANPGSAHQATAPITGVDVGATLTASGGQLSNNSGTSWAASTTYVSGQTLVRASLTASGQFNTPASVTVTVNGVSAGFTVATRAAVAPAFVDLPDQVGTVGASVSITLGVSNPDGSTLTFGVNQLPAGLALNTSTGVITGTCTAAGNITSTFTVSDGSQSDTMTAVWTVSSPADTTPPVITLLGANPLQLSMGAAYIEPGYTATDNNDGVITGSVLTSNNIDANVVGSYSVTYTVSDAAGNVATRTRAVNVVAVEPITPNAGVIFSAHSLIR